MMSRRSLLRIAGATGIGAAVIGAGTAPAFAAPAKASEMAAKVRPEGGGGDYGTGGGLDHLGFGTLAFTRAAATAAAMKAPAATASSSASSSAPSPSPSPSPSASASASTSEIGTATESPSTTAASADGTKPQGGTSGNLAETGAGDIAAVAATGMLAIAGGFLALRRRRAGDNLEAGWSCSAYVRAWRTPSLPRPRATRSGAAQLITSGH
ncbi:LPXTG cell wall anchor domain-containing protein [Actinacidiphila oryziradicis]|uniref:LPXTG cell wall anchor domain-containing protein n=2 Tax=Actinacidiphila oryziradicis TaxID=2571141 RepID=A0A4U0SWQ7_9ACTN|nr:LPXTG cell wall anchor domain-containing protein [Actinacidiphila oryziradicis]